MIERFKLKKYPNWVIEVYHYDHRLDFLIPRDEFMASVRTGICLIQLKPNGLLATHTLWEKKIVMAIMVCKEFRAALADAACCYNKLVSMAKSLQTNSPHKIIKKFKGMIAQ